MSMNISIKNIKRTIAILAASSLIGSAAGCDKVYAAEPTAIQSTTTSSSNLKYLTKEEIDSIAVNQVLPEGYDTNSFKNLAYFLNGPAMHYISDKDMSDISKIYKNSLNISYTRLFNLLDKNKPVKKINYSSSVLSKLTAIAGPNASLFTYTFGTEITNRMNKIDAYVESKNYKLNDQDREYIKKEILSLLNYMLEIIVGKVTAKTVDNNGKETFYNINYFDASAEILAAQATLDLFNQCLKSGILDGKTYQLVISQIGNDFKLHDTKNVNSNSIKKINNYQQLLNTVSASGIYISPTDLAITFGDYYLSIADRLSTHVDKSEAEFYKANGMDATTNTTVQKNIK